MVEMDSTPSKLSRTPKIFNFNNYNLDLQKYSQIFFKYDRNFHNFLGNSSTSLIPEKEWWKVLEDNSSMYNLEFVAYL